MTRHLRAGWFLYMRALCFLLVLLPLCLNADTVALWLFDEQEGMYPSSILSDAMEGGYPLTYGRGARMVDGRYGRALEPAEPAPIDYSFHVEGDARFRFGLAPLPVPEGRTMQPLWWETAYFAALLTKGENHLRKPELPNPIQSQLNLGAFDWTVEFWLKLNDRYKNDGVIFEIGSGPRGENDLITRLSLLADRRHFVFYNQPTGKLLHIPTDAAVLKPLSGWHHLAFTYSASSRQIRHYVDGRLQQLPAQLSVRALPDGEESYLTIARDGLWQHPLSGALDELRISDSVVYTGAFEPPASFSLNYGEKYRAPVLKAGPPLLFGGDSPASDPVQIGSRKYLFIDDALVADSDNITFTVNPPRRAERVLDEIRGHLSVIEDENGLLRIYSTLPGRKLGVILSRDGVNWYKPNLGSEEVDGARNVVISDPVNYGAVFIDPNAPPEERWKYVSGIENLAVYLYTSPDGFSFKRHETALLPLKAGSQSVVYYDDQRQLYVGHHRSDYGATPNLHNLRRFVRTEVKDLKRPWPFDPVTPEKARQIAKTLPTKVGELDPWFLDNGPLTPTGFSLEFPIALGPDPELDPVATDIYATKVVKYPWAPDAYICFPSVYFHYKDDGPPARQALGSEEYQLGSGTNEVQVAVSRDGIHWKRYPRPAYAGLGNYDGIEAYELFLAQGLVRRGDEIWQYLTGHEGNGFGYHSPYTNYRPNPVYRLVQRLDGFVSADSAYTGGWLKTRPLTFEGDKLVLNIDTGSAGYTQVGILDADGKPISGYSVDDCVYINGNFIRKEVEWLHSGTDVSPLQGRSIQILFQMRGSKLYSLQFKFLDSQ